MTQLDSASELALVSFAARLLLSQLDRQLLVERGLESFLDFARGSAGAVFLFDAERTRLEAAVVTGSEGADGRAVTVPADEAPWPELVDGLAPHVYPAGRRGGVPVPAAVAAPSDRGRECLCVPLVGDANRVLGAVTIEREASDALEEGRLQSLIVLQSILALALEQASARERLLEANAELEALYAAKNKVIDHLSHELKTPLAVLEASAALLGRAAVRRDDDRAAAVIARMERATARLLELQQEAQDIAEADIASEASAEIALASWVPEVLASIAALHRHRTVEVEAAIGAVRTIVVPEPPLRKALIGMVRNAIEATADGGRVRVSAEPRPGGGVVLEVAGSGRGFDDATRRQIFHGFVHAGDTDDYASRKPYDQGAGGKGLDLLRTKRFAEAVGIAIEVESEPGRGSRFRLVFPEKLCR
jgi:signal transduction histidine kinase